MSLPTWQLHTGDSSEQLQQLAAESVQCVVTSPPYWGLRDYGTPGQIGLERTLAEYVEKMVEVFRDVRRVLRDDGTLWLNLGDTYNAYNGGAGPGSKLSGNQTKARPKLKTGYGLQSKAHKPKDLLGIPWTVAMALREDGWYLRDCIIWHKPNPMPESVRDRTTKAHEYLFLLSKQERYYYDADAIKEPMLTPEASTPEDLDRANNARRSAAPTKRQKRIPSGWDTGPGGHREKTGRYRGGKHSVREGIDTKGGNQGRGEAMQPSDGKRNKRSVWTIPTRPFKGAHFATFPPELIAPCVLAGSRPGDLILDPFAGAGTTLLVALDHQRNALGIELSPEYLALARRRIQEHIGLLATEERP